MIRFELSRITGQKSTKTALVVRLPVLITVNSRCYVRHGTACRLAPKLLKHHPVIHVIRYKLRIYSQEDFKPKIREKLQIFSLTGKTIFL